ncbi:ABC-type transport system, involved in lipoprotein release, permease component [Aquimarina amphilecti]|uniref:ABC-type transport system, involved in lipoprotein release, permease component n=1 Tax=Aquimarina amphilecti TaxID=1038014 RepID=A0A1H7QQ41_AQUAM|nr:ABC transporter permease [Aquimarina amphilecti]SEL50043.1 ABC-type transport system, involved in lipoprotein release, permease component [Aquimarina amphilecti]
MIRNYFKIAFRNLWKDRIFTSLNIIGLTAAFSVAILLTMYAVFQLSFDRFHEQAQYLYQIYSEDSTPNGFKANLSNPEPFAAAFKNEIAGVEKITRHRGSGILVSYRDKQLNMHASYVDPDFFTMFSFPIIKGNTQNPITSGSSIVITEKAAKRIFGSQNPIGETVSILRDEKEVPFTITAIAKDFPNTSSMGFDIALNFKSQPKHAYARNIGRWDMKNHEVYMQLSKEMTPDQLEKSTTDFTQLHYRDEIDNAKRDGAQPNIGGVYKQIRLLPVSDIPFANFSQGKAIINRTMPYLVFGIAILIVCIACFNFINMSIAKSAQRLKEIGMRKTLGANKLQLFFQFWGESILIFLTATGLGILTASLLLQPFQTLFKTKASFETIFSPSALLGLILSLTIITIISGGYPSLLMSRLGTLQSLKGKIEKNGKNFLRNGLIIFQFGITILLISGTLVLWNQVEFMRTKDLGFNKDQVIAFPLNGKRNDQQAIQLLRDALEDKTTIMSITASNNILGFGKDGNRSTSFMGFEYKGRGVNTHMLVVDKDYVETLDLNLIEGRSFRKNLASDSLSVIINESMAKQLNEKEILNTKIILEDSVAFSVVGVIKDFNFQELDRTIAPMTLFALPNWNLRNVYVKVAPDNLEQSFINVKTAWESVEPNAEFLGSFLDENIERTLHKERTMIAMIGSGSLLAIILSCIGLFSISLQVVAQRRKEIGIRKVVGASVSKITMMLSADFLKLVFIAFIIATPIAWYFSSQWLQNYTYHINLTFWIFLTGGSITVFIALATISIKTVKAAIQNPVKSLKTE